MSVGATIVVDFGETVSGDSAWAVVELDETLNLDSEGEPKTEFSPGDEVWFWVQHDPSLIITAVRCTSGMAVDSGIVRRTRIEEFTWIAEPQVEMAHLPVALPEIKWYGNVGSGMTRDGRRLTITETIPCTGDATLAIDVHLYRYVPPPMDLEDGESWRSVVVVHLEALP